MEPITIISSRGKTVLLLLVSCGFVALSVFLRLNGDTSFAPLAGGGFFALGVAVFAWMLARPFTLDLDANGWRLTGGTTRKPQAVAWDDLAEVFEYRLPKGGTMVGYNLKEHARTRGMALSRALGADGAIPGSWPISKAELAELLEQYRQYYAN